MSKTVFQVMGLLISSFATVYVLGGLLYIARHPPRAVSDLGFFVVVAVTLVIVGVGVYYRRKSAALGCSVLLLCAALSQVHGALHPIPGYWNWLGFLWAGLLLLPLLMVAKYWNSLSGW